jgi:hypothetical protein
METVFKLHAFMRENGYTENSITKLIEVLTSIMSKGYFIAPNGAIIGATSVHPFFKVNEKSIRVRLNTNDVKDMIIANHPSNSWAYLDNLLVGSTKFFKSSITERNQNNKIGGLSKYVVVL